MSQIHRFDHSAMATPWTITIADEDADSSAWAAEQAIAVIDRIEEDLSRFKSTSYVSQLGRLQAGHQINVSRETYECLELAMAVWHETKGAFDVTVAREASSDETWTSGMKQFALCENERIQVSEAGLALDLGGLGKGFALDEISQLYQEHDIANAFLDSGGSTFLAMGNESAAAEGWPASIGPYGVIALKNQALSASGLEVQGQHIIDPRTGLPVETGRQRTWVQTESAALADALSTATLVMSDEEIEQFCEAHPEVTVMMG